MSMEIFGMVEIGIAGKKKNENRKILQFYFYHMVNKFVLQRFILLNSKSIVV